MSTPPAQGPSTRESIPAVDRLGSLLEELRTLLESSRTLVRSAKAEIAARVGLPGEASAEVHRDLAATAQRLERMAELVHAAMQSASRPLGSVTLSRARPVTLGEAVSHALDVVAPLAAARNVRLTSATGPVVDALPAGGLYTVVLNGLQNAIEAVAARGGGGTVSIAVRPHAAPQSGYGRDARDWYVLEVTDDGAGPPPDSSRCFDLGYSTKPKGAGVGLAVARSVVQGMGGSIELSPREGGRGAMLRVRFPSMARPGVLLGGAA